MTTGLLKLTDILPLPGPVWGPYPVRPASEMAPPWRGLLPRPAIGACRRIARRAETLAQAWQGKDDENWAADLQALRLDLRRRGLLPELIAETLAAAVDAAERTLGQTPRPTQLLASAVLLDNRMAEMATGEGKTLAIGLAAAVAGLAGLPVHVATANNYLAQRDAQRLAPFFAAFGLEVGALSGTDQDDAKRTIYRRDIVYATAKDLAFDFLRDRQTTAGAHPYQQAAAVLGGAAPPQLLMRGLCLAILDEADSILLDEADVPLILSRTVSHGARRAFMWQALALARKLEAGRDFRVIAADRSAVLTPAGDEKLAQLAAGLGGPWQRPRYRREAVNVALAGLHALHRNQHYLVRDDSIELLDEVTGRVAVGRVWSRGLHTVVALKEGLKPPAETETVAQTTFQRFFQRYWRLAGISGTLREARAELKAVYGSTVLPVPLHQPGRRRTLPPRRFADRASLFAAAAKRVAEFHAAGRPVLVGTDSVDDSQLLAAHLDRLGIGHRVLNALHDADEAAIVADAGRAGAVTVATRMAGRGTDIELDNAARAAGGLHVLNCQHNPSRRLDRQLAGRAARHGDPGSAEAWFVHGGVVAETADDLPAKAAAPRSGWLLRLPTQIAQWREEQRRSLLRRNLLEQDLHWEKRLAFAGSS
ncbi:DEAD/DEAH box helicase [Piscinibacter sakaiensis]|uniref:preprotein translocase subunit SecA n=1 Tax=Piscinibacter sakaiensis TaxID=1547922 RepID=UPI003AAB38A9